MEDHRPVIEYLIFAHQISLAQQQQKKKPADVRLVYGNKYSIG